MPSSNLYKHLHSHAHTHTHMHACACTHVHTHIYTHFKMIKILFFKKSHKQAFEITHS